MKQHQNEKKHRHGHVTPNGTSSAARGGAGSFKKVMYI